ncbi:MAG: 4Fe-4S binding protein [Spirochaetales bacterium]|nr:4Fe-4S binding protein [Spirochaetales bacterium]
MKTLLKQKAGSAPFISSAVTALLLSAARLKGPEGIILFDRFLPGLGWLQIFLITVYAGTVANLLITKPNSRPIRLAIWCIFSIVFFSQLLAGIFISDIFLMSGKLHIPVPALIIAGPFYRNSSFFMPVLFLSTIILTGSGWCSYLCYFGGWDGIATTAKKSVQFPKKRWKLIRYIIFLLVISTALLFRFINIPPEKAALFGIAFGIAGILIMLFISRRNGFMAHCSYYCPIGILSNFLGKISPFRIKIDSDCSNCMGCSNICKYDALSVKDLKSGRAGFNCTLCGDCISSCSSNLIYYKFLKLSPESSRYLFIILISAVHASFLGIARI